MFTALVFIVIFITGCLAALFIDAYLGICLYVFEYFLHPPGRWWGENLPDLRYAFSIGVIIIISFVIRRHRYSANKIFDVPQTKWLLLFGIIIVLTMNIAVDQIEHMYFMTIFIKYLVLYILMIKIIDTPDKFQKLIGAFLLGQFYLGWIIYEVGRTAGGRVEGMGTADAKNANGLSAVLVVAVPFLIHYLITGKKWQKICTFIGVIFILNALILINSRGAFLAVLVSMTYYTLLSIKAPSFPKFNKLRLFGGIIAGVMFFLYLADPIFWDRMSTITSPPEDAEVYSGRERLNYWFTTFDMLADYPYGLGAMGYEKVSPEYLPPEVLSSLTQTRAVHSTYFQVLAEYGYHGLFVFIAFLLSNFRHIWRVKKTLIKKQYYEPYYLAIAIEAGFIAHLIAAIFINRLYSEVLYWSSAFIAIYGNIYLNRLNSHEDNIVPNE